MAAAVRQQCRMVNLNGRPSPDGPAGLDIVD